jgi:oligopeptide transport system substrate-binding protein
MFHAHRLFRAAVLASATMLSTAALSQVTFHRGNDGDPETLDVQKTSTIVEAHLTRDLLEGLMIHNAAGVVVPGVAESHTVSADGKVYTFTLRANAKWSNGDAVKASDFVYSFRRIMNPETGAKYANILYPLKNGEKINKKDPAVKLDDLGVKALDDRTLEITLERPTPYFLELLTHSTGLPVHPASVEKHGNNFVKPENWVSNGAYVLKEWTPNSSIRMEKNPHFHDAANVQIERIIYYPTPDFAAAARRFMAGELHFTTDIPADQVKFLKEKLGDQVKIAPYLGTYYLAFNMSKKPFDDVRVRQALSMAMDREFIAEQIWGGTMVPAYSFVPPGIGTMANPLLPPGLRNHPLTGKTKPGSCLQQQATVPASL